MTKFRRFGWRSGIATEVFVCDGRLRQATEFATRDRRDACADPSLSLVRFVRE
jgi:hypothetical protein